MYKFVLGGSGSGKSNKVFSDCITAATADESSHFLLITPEQSTTWAEKEIIRLHPCHATDNIDVVSFSRLAYRVFNELGMEELHVINDIEKAMILRRIGYEHRKELKIWGRGFDKPGFVDCLKSMISELYQYGLNPEDLKPDPSFGSKLNHKLEDLKIIYRAFRDELADRFTTAEEIPDILARNIHRSRLIRDSYVILDGFTGFTPIQYRIIGELLCFAREVVITVSIGEDESNPLFAMSREMTKKISETGDRNSIPRGDDIRLHTDSFLEHHLLRYDGAVYNGDGREAGPDGRLQPRIVRAGSLKEEAAFICREIQRLVKKEGLRYRETAVVCADMGSYGSILTHEMELSGIPSYMDETIGIADNALVNMITAALDIISTDYSYDSVVRYLKSGITEEDSEMIFAVDNYIYECGRRGYRRMREDWDYLPGDLEDIDREALNAYKNSVLDRLEPLRALFAAGAAPVPEIVSTIKALMAECGVQEKLAAMAEQFAADNDRRRQREYGSVYEAVAGILAGMAELLKDEAMRADEFSEILDAGIDQVKLGVIPSGCDRVTIGDITRSRIEGVKYLFVAGSCEGMLPKLLNRKNVITDTEKERLKTAGYELAPTAREDLIIQRYYLYRVLTKPARQLIMTYAGMDAKGSAQRPSYILVHLMKLYPQLTPERAEDHKDILDINAAVTGLGEMLREMRTGSTGAQDGKLKSLCAYLLTNEDTRDRAELMTAAALSAYRPHRLSRESVDLLYGDVLSGSVSRLETFAGCPYKYFAMYGLGLRETVPFALGAVDIGNISHAALEKIFSQAKKNGTDLKTLDIQERNRLVEECIQQAVLDDGASKYSDSARNKYIVKRVERVVKRSLWGLLENLNDDFRPYEMEWLFTPTDHLKSARLELTDGKVMELTGKVDRTDVDDTDPDRVAVRVIDYKSGSKKWDLNDVINGKDLQLTTYMAAVEELVARRFGGREVSPEQMYYYRVQDPIIDLDALGGGPAEGELNGFILEEKLKDEMRLDGIQTREEIEKLIPYVRDKAEGIGRRIVSGDIGVTPGASGQYTSCSFCAYRPLCGFDGKIEGYKYTADKKYSKDEQWQIISGQTNSEGQ